MKNTVQIALLAVIAGVLVYMAVTRTGDSDSTTTEQKALAEASSTEAKQAAATLAANPNPNGQPADPMAQAQQAAVDNRPKTTVSFGAPDKYEYDFGHVKQNSENRHVFEFTNTGTEPLIIESATGSCGCTVPDYPKEPIAPGAKGQIKVEYKPGSQKDAQQKQVTVVANTEPKQTILRIKAFVDPDPNAPATTPAATPVAVPH